MLNFFKSKVENNKKLVENFISLYILQGTNYILPLITFPYLSRVLGPENFGLISFANAFVAYFISLTDYGFNLSATRQVAIYKSDKNKIEEIFSSVLIIKVILAAICFLLLLVAVFTIDKIGDRSNLYYITFGLVIGTVFFPSWFFQGMEEMKYITVLNFILKLLSALGIFILVQKPSDYIIVQLINSCGSILIGATALILIKFKFKIKIKMPALSQLIFYIKDGMHIFFTSVLSTVYNQSNVFLLGIFTNNTIVGYFAVADKLRSVILSMLTPMTSSLYPHLSNLYRDNVKRYLNKHAQLLKLYSGFTLVLFLITFLFNEELIMLIAGKEFVSAVPIFKILIFSILINGIGHLYTTLFLIVKGDNQKVLRYFSYSVITYIVGTSSLYLLQQVNQYSLSYVLVISELCVVVFAFLYFIKWEKKQSFLLKTID